MNLWLIDDSIAYEARDKFNASKSLRKDYHSGRGNCLGDEASYLPK